MLQLKTLFVELVANGVYCETILIYCLTILLVNIGLPTSLHVEAI